MTIDDLLDEAVESNVTKTLPEEVGRGDMHPELISADAIGHATVVTREDAIFCGKRWADETCRQVDLQIRIDWHVADGDRIVANQTLFAIHGPARSLVTAERTILNFLQL